MNDLVRPPCAVLNVLTRGVGDIALGNGNDEFDVSVIVDGVRGTFAVDAAEVGEGGKTKRVCEGVAERGGAYTDEEVDEEAREETDFVEVWEGFRRNAGGVEGFRLSVRGLAGGTWTWFAVLGVTGEEGTGGSVPNSGAGRLRPFGLLLLRLDDDEKSKVLRTAVAGTGGRENVCLRAGADGGGCGMRSAGGAGGCMSTILQGDV